MATNDSNLANWMSNLDPNIHNVPLNQLAIPGTHDSFSHYLDKSGPLGPDADKAVLDLAKFLGPLVKGIIYDWSVTQSCSLTDQLNAGIRYFDLRVSTKPGSNDLFTLHCLYSNKLETCLWEVQKWLKDHPKEIILLDLNHFYEMETPQYKQCLSLILEVFGYIMCPQADVNTVTLSNLWEKKQQVLVFFHGPTEGNTQFWSGGAIPSPWPNVSKTDKLLQVLEANYNGGRHDNRFYVTQGILTPDTKFIMEHLGGSLRKSMCEKLAGPFVTWLNGKKAGKQGINVCIMDFCDMSGYPQTVVDLNNTLL